MLNRTMSLPGRWSPVSVVESQEQVRVHVATYWSHSPSETPGTDRQSVAHVVTVLEPHEATDLSGPVSVERRELGEVVRTWWLNLLWEALEPDLDPAAESGDRSISLAVMPTPGPLDDFAARSRGISVYELRDGSVVPGSLSPFVAVFSTHQADVSPEVLSQTLGHRLPQWPRGCATADLVTEWYRRNAELAHGPDREPEPITVAVPPDAYDEYRVAVWTQQSAPDYGAHAPHIRAVGAKMWRLTTSDSAAEQPVESPWCRAVSLSPPHFASETQAEAGGTSVDSLRGVSLLASTPGQPHDLVNKVVEFYGDPAGWDAVVLDLTACDPRLATTLQRSMRPAPDLQTQPETQARRMVSWRTATMVDALAAWQPAGQADRYRWTHRADRLDAVDAEPDVLRTPENDLLAYRPPTELPTSGLEIPGSVLGVWFTRTTSKHPELLGWLHTEDGLLVPLPLPPRANPELLSMHLHTLLRDHTGQSSSRLPLSPTVGDPVAELIRSVASGGLVTVTWNHLARLVETVNSSSPTVQ